MSDTPQVLLEHRLKTLKLPTFLREYEKVARRSAHEGLDHVEFLSRLVELELIDRERRLVERRIRAAKFPTVKSLDSFEFKAIPSLSKIQVLELTRCEWIERRENVIALGSSGTGKTHVAQGLGLAACQRGLSVRFVTAAALVHELMEARDERRLLRLQKQFANHKLLIIDELGFVPLSKTGAELLFELVSQRYERAAGHAHGSKTALSERYEISRPTVYAVGAAAQSVLRSHFETPLLQGAAVDVRVDDAQLRRAVVALRVLAPNAIRPIEDLVPLLYPGVKVSYGTIQQMLVEAEGRAARFNAQVSLGGVEAGALDEMFSQGEPVLAGVDLDSGYLFGLSLSATRDGEAWAGLLREGQAQGLGLSVVVKDAARGIAAGVSEVFPHAEQRVRRLFSCALRDEQGAQAFGAARLCSD